jgi:hypothetical protein
MIAKFMSEMMKIILHLCHKNMEIFRQVFTSHNKFSETWLLELSFHIPKGISKHDFWNSLSMFRKELASVIFGINLVFTFHKDIFKYEFCN